MSSWNDYMYDIVCSKFTTKPRLYEISFLKLLFSTLVLFLGGHSFWSSDSLEICSCQNVQFAFWNRCLVMILAIPMSSFIRVIHHQERWARASPTNSTSTCTHQVLVEFYLYTNANDWLVSGAGGIFSLLDRHSGRKLLISFREGISSYRQSFNLFTLP